MRWARLIPEKLLHRSPPSVPQRCSDGALQMLAGIPLRENVVDVINNRQQDLEFIPPFLKYWERRTNLEAITRRGILDGTELAKRVLEVAYYRALNAKGEYKGHIIGDWRKVADSADALAAAIQKFHLSTGYNHQKINWSKKAPTQLFPNWLEILPLETIIGRGVQLRGEPFDPQLIKEQAIQCFQALTTLEKFGNEAAITCKQFASEMAAGFRNIGKPEVIAFAGLVCEAIVFLNGEKPAMGNKDFLDLLSAGWSDIADAEQEWEHAARKSIEQLEADRVNFLAYTGPDWL